MLLTSTFQCCLDVLGEIFLANPGNNKTQKWTPWLMHRVCVKTSSDSFPFASRCVFTFWHWHIFFALSSGGSSSSMTSSRGLSDAATSLSGRAGPRMCFWSHAASFAPLPSEPFILTISLPMTSLPRYWLDSPGWFVTWPPKNLLCHCFGSVSGHSRRRATFPHLCTFAVFLAILGLTHSLLSFPGSSEPSFLPPVGLSFRVTFYVWLCNIAPFGVVHCWDIRSHIIFRAGWRLDVHPVQALSGPFHFFWCSISCCAVQ